jgi:hypothetical protein
LTSVRAQGGPDADLTKAAPDGLVHHAIDAQRAQQQRDPSSQTREDGQEARGV